MIPAVEKLEYSILKFSTHNAAEKGLNEKVAEGWQLVSYQAAGGDSAVLHFLLLSRPRRERFGQV
jgi:hypothetical protein